MKIMAAAATTFHMMAARLLQFSVVEHPMPNRPALTWFSPLYAKMRYLPTRPATL